MASTITAAQVAAAYQAILEVAPPGDATGAYALSVAAQINDGFLTQDAFETSLLTTETAAGTSAMNTTLPTLVTIDAFYGATPPSAAAFSNDATSTTVTAFQTAAELHNLGYSDANVWTILGANWAADPNSQFNKLYNVYADGTTNGYTQFIDAVYQREFGTMPSAANLQNLLNDIPGLTALLNGPAGHAASVLNIMGGLFGYLLYAGQTSGAGAYTNAANKFLTTAANDEVNSPGSSSVLYGPELLQQFTIGPQGLVLNVADVVSNGVGTAATEGSTVTFTVAGQNVAAGTVLDYTLTGVTAAEVQSGTLSGQVSAGSNGSAVVGVTLNNTPGEGLTGPLVFTVTGPSSSTASASVALTETPEVINAAMIALANAANGGAGAPVVVNTPSSGTETLFIQNTGGQPVDIAPFGIVIQGNATIVVNDVDGGGSVIDLPGSGSSTVNVGATVADDVQGGTGSLNVVLANGFVMTDGQFFDGVKTATNTLTVQGSADLTPEDDVAPLVNIQSVALANGAALTVTTADLAGEVDAGKVAGVETFTQPSITGASGGTAALIVDNTKPGAGTVNLTGKLTGVTSLTVDGGATVILGSADIANIATIVTQVQGKAAGTIVSSVAAIQSLLAHNPNLSYGVVDTLANLTAAPASVLQGAKEVGTPAGTLTIAQALQLVKLVTPAPGAAALNYTVGDSPANIASDIVYNDELTALNPGAVLPNVVAVALSGSATVAQAEEIEAKNLNVFPTGIAISDTAGNVGSAILVANGNGAPTPAGFDTLDLPAEGFSGTIPAGSSYSLTVNGTADLTQAANLEDYVKSTAVTLGYVSFSGTFSVVTSIGEINFENAIDPVGTTAALKAATSVSLGAGNPAVTAAAVSAAQKVMANAGVTLGGTYKLSDTSAGLLQFPIVLSGAAAVTVTDPTIGVAVATAIVRDAAASAPVKFGVLSDTATNLFGAAPNVLSDATSVTVLGNATVAQATGLAAFLTPASLTLDDSITAILAASPAVLKATKTITVEGTIGAADAVSLINLLASSGIKASTNYSISDSAANLIALVSDAKYVGSKNQTALNGATAVTLTDTAITVANADKLFAGNITNLKPYSISDTVKNVVAAAADPALLFASAVTAIGTSTVAQAETLSTLTKLTGGYAISDTPANVVGAIGGFTAVLNAAIAPVTFVGGAGTLSVGGTPTVTVAQATALLSAVAFTNWSHTFTLLANTTADVIDGTSSIPANVVTAAKGGIYLVGSETTLTSGDLQWVKANANGYIVQDTFAAVTGSSGNKLVASQAAAVVVTDAGISADNAEALFKINPSLQFTLSDTNTDFTSATLTNDADGIKAATSVVVLGPISVATAEALLALNPKVTFTLSDTAANLTATAAASALLAATFVTVSDTASVAQATTILAGIATLATAAYSITDTMKAINGAAATKAGIAALDGATVVGATNPYKVTVTDSDVVTLTVAEVASFGEGAGKLAGWATILNVATGSPVFYILSDTMANLATALGSVAGAQSVTAVAGGAGVTVATVQAVETFTANLTGSYALSDTIAALTAVPANAVVKGAATITVTTPGLLVSQVTPLLKLNTNDTYSLADSAANLTASASAAAVTGATGITVLGAASVANVQAIEGLNSGAVTYSLTDTAANLAAASPAVLKGSAGITFTTVATAAQLAAVDSAIGVFVNPTLGVFDTAANLSAASQLVLTPVTLLTVDPKSTATATQGALLNKLTFDFGVPVPYAVSDTAQNLVTADVSFSNATTAAATGTATAAQADVLETLTYGSGVGTKPVNYAVSDSSANLLDLNNKGGWAAGTGATAVTVTDAAPINIATAEYIFANNPVLGGAKEITYSVSDALDRVVQALGQNGGAPSFINLNQVLGDAASVSVGGTTTIPMLGVGAEFVVTDSTAALQNIGSVSASLLSTAGYVVDDTIANELGSLSFTNAGYLGDYIVDDNATNVAAAAPSFIDNAYEVKINAPATYAQIDAVKTEIGGFFTFKGPVVFSLSDTAANLFTGSSLKVDASFAQSITVTTAATGAQAASLLVGHPTKDTFSISDTEADMFTGTTVNFATAVKAATSVTISGTVAISDAQALSLLAINNNATYSVSDVPANLFTSSGALKPEVSGASTVSVAGATLSVAQASALNALGAKFTGTYALADSSANLAGASSAILTGATLISQSDLGTGGATIVQAQSIVAGLGGNVKTIPGLTVTDSAADVAASGVTQGLLTDIFSLTIPGTTFATAAQGSVLAGETFGPGKTVIAYKLKDTSADILNAGTAGVKGASTVIVTDQISVATAGSIAAINPADSFSLKDGATAFGPASLVPVEASASSIEVTGGLNGGQATLLSGYFNAINPTPTFTFDGVSDTFGNLVANEAAVGHAATVNVTGTAAVGNVLTLQGDFGASKVNVSGVQILDTVTNIVAAFSDQDTANESAIISGASKVTPVPGSVATVSQATILESLAKLDTTAKFIVEDTLGHVAGASATLLNSANVSAVTANAVSNDSGTATVFSDGSVTNPVTVQFQKLGAGTGETINPAVGGLFSNLAGVDQLTLNAKDFVNLAGYGVTGPGAPTTGSALPAAGASELIQGVILASGSAFQASASGTADLLVWNSGGALSGAFLANGISASAVSVSAVPIA